MKPVRPQKHAEQIPPLFTQCSLKQVPRDKIPKRIHAQKRKKLDTSVNKVGLSTPLSASEWRLILDGSHYFQEIHSLLEQAERFVAFANWQLDSRLRLTPQLPPLRNYLQSLLERKPLLEIYILAWDHSHFYWFEREGWWQTQIWRSIHPRLHLLFDNEHPLAACHHEKMAIFDDRIAVCGGIDFSLERWDTENHSFRNDLRELPGIKKAPPHHDVALKVHGSAVIPLTKIFKNRWKNLTGVSLFNEAEEQRKPHYQNRRTQDALLVSQTKPPQDHSVQKLFTRFATRFQRELWIEAQYYWSDSFNSTLIRNLRSSSRLKKKAVSLRRRRVRLILNPPHSLGGLTAWSEYEELLRLFHLQRHSQKYGIRLRAWLPYSRKPTRSWLQRPVYVHSKLIFMDDRALSVGSANLSERTLKLDTELQLTLIGRTREFRQKLRSTKKILISHWKKHSSSYLRKLDPKTQLLTNLRKSPLLTLVKWSKYFDAKAFHPKVKKIKSPGFEITEKIHTLGPLQEIMSLILISVSSSPGPSRIWAILLLNLIPLALIPYFRNYPILSAESWIRAARGSSPYGVRSGKWISHFLLHPRRSLTQRIEIATRLRIPMGWIFGTFVLLRTVLTYGVLSVFHVIQK